MHTKSRCSLLPTQPTLQYSTNYPASQYPTPPNKSQVQVQVQVHPPPTHPHIISTFNPYPIHSTVIQYSTSIPPRTQPNQITRHKKPLDQTSNHTLSHKKKASNHQQHANTKKLP
ncbi:uncharacterized protein BO72DRAFT_302085 [Aspergillus fijiensis CBS 313.89]|uniref:Uncharacterized protein n=1 Tax=Aspergillus fijiensis CBS 313.89 TaxID=1448319 RepID=A0A8G1S0T6_9EURO|nr:uncharacterized protein BO72DRAFT_302085 [Aspergillus fijiensis CBS 313.89]RAK80331.1 hypothetical protein BO72DRAFT_302085 [Aspergillus fijiensis CBS 313.89]